MAFFNNEVLSVTSDTTPLSLDIPSGANLPALCTVEDGDVRITLHGSNPNNSTKNGIRIAAGTIFEISGNRDLNGFRVIKAGTDNASVSVNYQQKD